MSAGFEKAAQTPPDDSSPSESFVGLDAATDVHPGDIYTMLHLGMRESDGREGNSFLKRYLIRPEELWQRWQQKAHRVARITSYEKTPEALLDHLRAHVGFGAGAGKADDVALRLTKADLRKLIKLAVPFWQTRGRRDALEDAIRTFAGVRPLIVDWFEVRTLVDEVFLGYEGSEEDPWIIHGHALDVPAGESDGPMAVVIRIPDDGTLDRTLVTDLCKLARPMSERYELGFVNWLDTFQGGRQGHWVTEAGLPAEWVAGAKGSPPLYPGLLIKNGTVERVSTPSSGAWSGYVWSALLKITADVVELRFYDDEGGDGKDHYFAELTAPDTVKLRRRVGGVTVTLATNAAVNLATVQIGFKIEVLPIVTTGKNQIRIWIDGNQVIEDTSDSAHVQGTVAVAVLTAGGPGVRLMRTELFETPLTVTKLTP